MKGIILGVSLVVIGALIGSSVTWVMSYYPPLGKSQEKIAIEDILKYSSTVIAEQNYSCDGDIKETVGDVVASIIEFNSAYKRNMLTLGCYGETCALSVTNCMPWQDQECGSRILKFNIDGSNEILENTFTCIDMP
jgi:hypothetical protein